jgi:hypothetical protein
MPSVIVLADRAIAIRRRPGRTVTIVNDGAVDIFIDSNINRLNAARTGQIPDGTKVLAGDSFQWEEFPESGIVYARSTAITTIEVQP